MTDNRREFLKKSASLSAALSVGGINTALSHPITQSVEQTIGLISMAKDAGMEINNAYFTSMTANKQFIELAKQMDALGAIAGIDSFR